MMIGKKASNRIGRTAASAGNAHKQKPLEELLKSRQSLTSPTGSLDESLGYAIRRAQIHAYQVFAIFMHKLNIRPAQYALLVLIHENPGLTQSVVGSVLGIEKANLAGLLTELHQLGVIARTSLITDRRVYSLHLTASGRRLVRKLIKRHEQYEDALSSNLGPEGKALLLLLLGRLVQK